MSRHMPSLSGRVLGYRAVQVLEYVRIEIIEHGQAPSYGMIRDALCIDSKGDVCRIIKSLEKRGLLSRAGAGRVRRIRLHGFETETPQPLPTKPNVPEVDLAGTITIHQAAKMLRVDVGTLRHWRATGIAGLSSFVHKHVTRFWLSEIEAFSLSDYRRGMLKRRTRRMFTNNGGEVQFVIDRL